MRPLSVVRFALAALLAAAAASPAIAQETVNYASVNNFIVDGLSANDDAAGLSGIPYGVDAVDQFQVVTSGGQNLVVPSVVT